MKDLILPLQELLHVCHAEGVRSAKSIASGALLPVLAWCAGAKHVLEIGTLEGFTALAIGMQLELMGGDRKLVLCDIQQKWVNNSIRLLKKNAPSVQVVGVAGDSSKIDWGKYLPRRGRFELAYIDGGHAKEEVAADLRQVIPWISKHGMVLLHDYIKHPKCGIVEAVDEFMQMYYETWSFVPLPAAMGAPMALLCPYSAVGLPIGKRGRIGGV